MKMSRMSRTTASRTLFCKVTGQTQSCVHFLQALEIERRVQASRGNRHRQKKRAETRDAVDGTTISGIAKNSPARQETGKAGKDVHSRADLHPRPQFSRSHAPPHEPIGYAARSSAQAEKTSEKSRGKVSLTGTASLNEVWQIKGRAR
jgi:hypothetical protein